jgi:hypothetical protein
MYPSSCIAIHTASRPPCKAPCLICIEFQVLSFLHNSFAGHRHHPHYNIDLNNRYLDIDFGIRLSTLPSSYSRQDYFQHSPCCIVPLNRSLGIVHHIHLASERKNLFFYSSKSIDNLVSLTFTIVFVIISADLVINAVT